jgi:hypothetical protein
MEEMLDQRRNWMYKSPNELDRDKEIKEILGVRDYEMNGVGKRSKSVVERQFEGDKSRLDKNNRGNTERPGLDGTTPETAATKAGLDPTGRYTDEKGDRSVIPELNPVYLFNSPLADEATASFGSGFGRKSILPSGIPDPRFGVGTPPPGFLQGPQQQRDFQTLWDSQKTPFSRIADPINDPTDATRTVMDPFAAKKPAVAAPAAVQSSGGDAFGFGSSLPSGGRSDFLGPSTFRGPAAPSYTPPASAPVSAPALQSKPAVLEIPRPRF